MPYPLRKKVRFNYHDYQLFPEEKRCEIIDGDLHMTPAPYTTHQKISGNLYDILRKHIEGKKLGEILYAPVDVILSDEDIVQPDLVFISQERLGILTKENIRSAPDLVVEILSPSNTRWDREVKYKLYEQHGVREYWIVDPDARSIEVFQMKDEGFVLVRAFGLGTHLKSPLLSLFGFLVDDIFQ